MQQQRSEILDAIRLEDNGENKLDLKTLCFWDNTELRVGLRIRISFMILSIQQMMGINMLVYFSTTIFLNIGYSSSLSQLLAAVMNTGFWLGTLPTIWLIEKWGRRSIMIWTAVGCLLSMILFTTCIAIPNPSLAVNWTAVTGAILFNAFYGFGWVGCPWLYGPEVSSSNEWQKALSNMVL